MKQHSRRCLRSIGSSNRYLSANRSRGPPSPAVWRLVDGVSRYAPPRRVRAKYLGYGLWEKRSSACERASAPFAERWGFSRNETPGGYAAGPHPSGRGGLHADDAGRSDHAPPFRRSRATAPSGDDPHAVVALLRGAALHPGFSTPGWSSRSRCGNGYLDGTASDADV